jgi:hypothetical protein
VYGYESIMRAFKIGGVVVSRYGVFMICILFFNHINLWRECHGF